MIRTIDVTSDEAAVLDKYRWVKSQSHGELLAKVKDKKLVMLASTQKQDLDDFYTE